MDKSMWIKAPALPSAIGLCLGILSGYLLPSVSALLLVVLFIAFSVGAYYLFRFHKAPMGLGVLVFAGGYFLGSASTPETFPENLNEKKGTLTGKVIEVNRTPETMRVVMAAESWIADKDSVAQEVSFNVLCTLRGVDSQVMPGAEISVNGKLHDINELPDVPYQVDYNRFLFIDGIVARITAFGSDDYSVSDATVSSWQRFLHDTRLKWLSAISEAGFDEPTTDFLMAVIGGDDFLLSEDMEEQFRQTGLSHILAISGMHVSIILIVLSLLLYPMKLVGRMRNVYFFTLALFVVLYAMLTGGSPSACRAAAMCCVVIGNRILEVKTNPIQALSLAVIVLLCFKPLWIFLPGFQFSVCAVMGIIAFMPLLNMVPQRYTAARFCWAYLILPVIAVSGTLVLTIFYFHSFSLNFWLANIVSAVFVPLLISVGFISSLLSLLGLHSFVLGSCGDFLYMLMHGAITTIAGWFPESTVGIFLGNDSLIAIVVIVITLAWLTWNYNHIRAAVIVPLSLIVLLLLPFSAQGIPTAELYVPRHYDHTDIVIVHNGRSYIWTTATDSLNIGLARNGAAEKYRDFYRHRGTGSVPALISGNFSTDELTVKDNVMTLNGRSLARIDNDSILPSGHVDVALVSELYGGNMAQLVKRVNADSIMLSAAINYSRHQKFVRQLDTLGVKYRSLRDKGLAWQFN